MGLFPFNQVGICSTSRFLGLGIVLSLLLGQLTLAQSITTVAGGNQLSAPAGVFVDVSGNLYVSDQTNNRVLRFAPNSTSTTAGVTVAGGNGQGSAASQLSSPTGVFVDGANNLYVADLGNNRVQRFAANANAGETVAGGNGAGAGANQLNGPISVYVDRSGNLFVADALNGRVQRFGPNSSSGLTAAGGNGRGSAANQISGPFGVYGDGSGNLYVVDQINNRVQRFGPNSTPATAGVTVAGGGGVGTGVNQLNRPYGLYVDGASNVYIADQGNRRVQRYQLSPPVIVSQPVAGSSVCAGATVTVALSATANTPSLIYQWYSASGSLSGQTSPTLTLANVQASNATSYYAVVTSTDNALSTTSTAFQLSVLSLPSVSLVASGSLSAGVSSVTLTASGGSLYQFSTGATQVGTGPTATVSAPGLYYVKAIGTNGCSEVAATRVSQAPTPDLSPLLYARPTGVYGTTPVTVVVDVLELSGVASSGLITLKISQDEKLVLSLPADATSIDNRPVSNSAWQLSGPSGGYYTLSTNQVVPANGRLSVGLKASLSGGGSSGALTVSGVIVGGSGGDQRLLNNTASGRIEYFPQ